MSVKDQPCAVKTEEKMREKEKKRDDRGDKKKVGFLLFFFN